MTGPNGLFQQIPAQAWAWGRGMEDPFGNAAYVWVHSPLSLQVSPLLVTIKADLDLPYLCVSQQSCWISVKSEYDKLL